MPSRPPSPRRRAFSAPNCFAAPFPTAPPPRRSLFGQVLRLDQAGHPFIGAYSPTARKLRLERFWQKRRRALAAGTAAEHAGRILAPPPPPPPGHIEGWAGGCGGGARSKKWVAMIYNEGKQTRLGYFDDEEEAARKYDEAAAMLERPLNFPKDEGETSAVKMGDRSKIPDKGQSAFRGVSWNKGSKKWQAVIYNEGKQTRLGCFDDEEEAACKYDEAAATMGRPLNFPKSEVDAKAVKRGQGKDLTKIPDKGNPPSGA